MPNEPKNSLVLDNATESHHVVTTYDMLLPGMVPSLDVYHRLENFFLFYSECIWKPRTYP